MIYKIFRVLFVILIVLVITNIESVAQDYYPLQIGNRWDYRRQYWEYPNPLEIDTFYVEVTGDSLFTNGKAYFILNRTDLSGGMYVRVDTNNIYYFDITDNKEDTLYRLNAQPGEQWQTQFGFIYTVHLDSISTSQFFSINTTIQFYTLDGLILSYIELSDKFGPVVFHSPGEPPGTSSTVISLIGCLIDSVQYGTPVKLENEMNFVTGYSLAQNYPNPFNPSTVISYSIAKEDLVTLKVFDILGNDITTLVNEYKSAGNHQIEFIAGEIPSGIYFYTLMSGNYISTKKLILLK